MIISKYQPFFILAVFLLSFIFGFILGGKDDLF